jgi:GT2 family glycosyltransferase
MTSLSIVIVSYRCWQRLDTCLKSIQAQSLDFIEVIVVDNHSNDGKIKEFMLAHPTVQFIQQEINGGFAQACNKGAAIAKGEWILFLNPDTILEPNTLSPLLQKTNTQPDWKLIGIKQLDEKGKDTYPFGLFLQWWNVWPPIRSIQRLIGGKSIAKKEWSAQSVSYPDWISGSFVLMRYADFKTIGGWDEQFWMYCEDQDLSKAANSLGWKRVMYNEIKCIHSHGGSSRINPKVKAITKSAVIISNFKYIKKHMVAPGKWIAQITLLLMTFINILIALPFSSTKRQMVTELLYNRK